MNYGLSRLFITLSLFILGLGTQEAYGMHSAKKLFHAACTGISLGIQGKLAYEGATELREIQQTKVYLREDGYEQQTLANQEYPDQIKCIRKTLSERGERKFNNPDHYKDVFILPSDSGMISTLPFPGRGTIQFMPFSVNQDDELSKKAADLETKTLKNKSPNYYTRSMLPYLKGDMNAIEATMNHEAEHIDNRDTEKSKMLKIAAPFVIGFVSSKIKAPIKALTQARRWASSEPSCLKSMGKIPGAFAKTGLAHLGLIAHSTAKEINADNGIPDNIGQLEAAKKFLETNKMGNNDAFQTQHHSNPDVRIANLRHRIEGLKVRQNMPMP